MGARPYATEGRADLVPHFRGTAAAEKPLHIGLADLRGRALPREAQGIAQGLPNETVGEMVRAGFECYTYLPTSRSASAQAELFPGSPGTPSLW